MKVRHIPESKRVGFGFVIVCALVCLLAGAFMGGATVWMYKPELRAQFARRLPDLLGASDEDDAVSLGEYRAEKVQLLWDVWDILDREYIEPEAIKRDKMIYGAVAGMVSSLNDSHSVFVEPVAAQVMSDDMSGSFEGIGATVNVVDGRLTIVAPLAGSPAVAAGLKAGDVVLEVDDQPVEGLSLIESVSLIRGPEGTVVRLLIEREGVEEPFIVPVTRAKVENPIIETEMLDGGVAYLSLGEFNAVSGRKVRDALKDLQRENPVGLVLDLRGNPGGYLQQSVEIANEFLPPNSLVLTERERERPDQEFRAQGGGVATEIPLVVLIDGGSASASEIVAGAIKDNGRGLLVGERSYGKGSVQNTHQLQGNASLRVTIARWYRPNGENLDGQGIEPDIAVELTSSDIQAGRDPQLDRAVDHLLGGE